MAAIEIYRLLFPDLLNRKTFDTWMSILRDSIKADPSKGDKIVRRRGRVYVINKNDPNRKQRQKGPGRKK